MRIAWPSAGRVTAAATLCAILVAAGPVEASTVDAASASPLRQVVDRLGEETKAFDGGALWGISVLDLDTGERADFQGDQWIKAASSLKATWMAAAILNSGVEQVEPLATSVFVWSSNDAAGSAIRLAGGIDAVNGLTQDLGMNGTLVVEWTFGIDQRSRYYPGAHPYLNYTTTRDLVTFWQWLYRGFVLDPSDTQTLLGWGRLPRSEGPNSGLLTRLPADAADWVSYKMGVLPPGRSYENDEEGNPIVVEGQRDTILGGGVVEIPGGHTYVVAIGGFGGYSWFGKVNFVSYASCRIYAVISGDTIDCDRSGDPDRVRLDTDPPTGGMSVARGTREFVSVRGWASDPDDPLGTIRVRFTVDGLWHGITRADEPHSWGSDPAEVLDGHGFEARLLTLLTPGEHEICGLAVNDGAGPDAPIGCVTLSVA